MDFEIDLGTKQATIEVKGHTYTAGSAPANTAPHNVNAGVDLTKLVGSTITLTGSAVDDETAMDYTWTLDGANVGSNLTYDYTVVHGAKTLKFTATDKGSPALSKSDEVIVTGMNLPAITPKTPPNLITKTDATHWVLHYTVDYDGGTTQEQWIMDGATKITNDTVNMAGVAEGATKEVYVWAKNEAGESSHLVELKVADMTKPSIILLGANPMTLEHGTAYTEPGATVTDNVDGNTLTADITGSVNENTDGSYTITYKATDGAGNVETVTRTVIVKTTAPADGVKPVITLVGDALITIQPTATYADARATATDDVNGDITNDIVITGVPSKDVGGINDGNYTPGTYTIKYNVSDAAGNAADEVTRTLRIASIGTAAVGELLDVAGVPSLKITVDGIMEPTISFIQIHGNFAQSQRTGNVYANDMYLQYSPTSPLKVYHIAGNNPGWGSTGLTGVTAGTATYTKRKLEMIVPLTALPEPLNIVGEIPNVVNRIEVKMYHNSGAGDAYYSTYFSPSYNGEVTSMEITNGKSSRDWKTTSVVNNIDVFKKLGVGTVFSAVGDLNSGSSALFEFTYDTKNYRVDNSGLWEHNGTDYVKVAGSSAGVNRTSYEYSISIKKELLEIPENTSLKVTARIINPNSDDKTVSNIIVTTETHGRKLS